jgi:ribosomal 50S subunit-recycling heat shock protein
MRIDKFLKVSRLVKRREIAKRLCDDGDMKINGKVAKPSSEVNEGDILELTLGKRIIQARILEIKPYSNKQTANNLYEIISDNIGERTPIDD